MKFLQSALLSVIVGSTLSHAFIPSSGVGSGRRFGLVVVHPTSTRTSISAFDNSAFCSNNGIRSSCRKMATDDDDENDGDDYEYDEYEGPLANGIDSVKWLPTVIGDSDKEVTSIRDGSEILPLFPLGGLVYTPNSEHVLNIFEPRYRQMYTDILMNGTKRFVVTMSHPSEQGGFAKTGVLFELEDLKEVSEQTADQIKYICNHKVTGRVKLHRVINPSAWEARDTYLKVEGEITDDTDKENSEKEKDTSPSMDETDIYGAVAAAKRITNVTPEEKDVRVSFQALVNLQHDLEEDVRFTRASVDSLAVADGSGDDGLWQSIRLWQSYAEQRLMGRQNELQMDFQEKLQEFLLGEKGMSDEELPSAIGFQDLSPALQEEVKDLQKRMAVELEPLILESTLTMQKILEAEDHKGRVNLLRYFIDNERNRLNAKKTLQGMFSPTTLSAETVDEADDDEKEKKEKTDTGGKDDAPPTSIFMDEPDAFQ